MVTRYLVCPVTVQWSGVYCEGADRVLVFLSFLERPGDSFPRRRQRRALGALGNVLVG